MLLATSNSADSSPAARSARSFLLLCCAQASTSTRLPIPSNPALLRPLLGRDCQPHPSLLCSDLRLPEIASDSLNLYLSSKPFVLSSRRILALGQTERAIIIRQNYVPPRLLHFQTPIGQAVVLNRDCRRACMVHRLTPGHIPTTDGAKSKDEQPRLPFKLGCCCTGF